MASNFAEFLPNLIILSSTFYKVMNYRLSVIITFIYLIVLSKTVIIKGFLLVQYHSFDRSSSVVIEEI